MFGWFRKRRRQRIARRRFPDHWEAILHSNALFFHSLSSAQQERLRRSTQIFVAEKNWEGCGGLQMTDEHRLTIAAQMSRLTLGFADEYFDDVKSILVYPDAYLGKSQDQIGSGVVVEGSSSRLGEAWYRGPVILSWADVLATGRQENFGRNVVIHEFAHQLDMRNSPFADGVPVIESRQQAEHWLSTMARDYERLSALCDAGVPNVLDCYGATNPAEFFAVASEVFFEQPNLLNAEWPDLFVLLRDFYLPPNH